MDFIINIYIAITFIISGIWVILRFYDYLINKSIYTILSISYLIGFALLSISMLVMALLGISFWYAYIWVIINMVVMYLNKEKTRSLLYQNKLNKPQNKIWEYDWLKYILGIVCLILLVYQHASITMNGTLMWDAWANWSLRGRVMHVADSVRGTQEVGREDRLSTFNYLGEGASDYPFMVPLGQTWIYHHLGYINEESMKYIFFFPLLALVIVVFEFFYTRFGVNSAYLSLIIILSLSQFSQYLMVGYMDSMIAIYVAMGVMFLIEYIESDNISFLYLSTLLISITAWIKNDGLFAICTQFVVFILLYWLYQKVSWRVIISFLGLNFGVLIGWKALNLIEGAIIGGTHEAFLESRSGDFMGMVYEIIKVFIQNLSGYEWLFFGVLVLLSIPYLLKKEYLILWYGIVYILVIFVLMLILAGTMQSLKDLIAGTVMARLLLQGGVGIVIISIYVFFQNIWSKKVL